MNMTFKDSDGKDQAVHLGSYGIGISRVMGVVAEIFSDDKGLIWPESIAPAKFHLVSIGDVSKQAHEVYSKLEEMGHKVIYDDRDLQAGEKLADADLLGIPTRLVISQKSLDEGGIEVKRRDSDEAKIQDLDLSWV